MCIKQITKITLLIALIFSQACADITIEQPLERHITDDDIVSNMRSILITEGAYVQPQTFLNPNLWVGYLNLGNITDVCDIKIDTTFATAIDVSKIKLDAESELFFSMHCNQNNIPNSFAYNGASEGSYSVEKINGTFLQASTYEAKVELIEGNLVMSGSTGQSGTMSITNDLGDQVITTTIRFVLDELNIGFLDQEVKTGSARAELKYQGTDFVETYIASISYMGNDLITIEVNGRTYNIDLSE